VTSITYWLWSVKETTFLQSLDDTFGDGYVFDEASSQAIAAFDDLLAADLDEIDSLRITRLEADRSSRWDV
jgi:hypothetical protein